MVRCLICQADMTGLVRCPACRAQELASLVEETKHRLAEIEEELATTREEAAEAKRRARQEFRGGQ